MPEIRKDDMTSADLNTAGKLNPQMLGSRKRPKPIQKGGPSVYYPDVDRYRPDIPFVGVLAKDRLDMERAKLPPVCGVRGRY